MLFYLARLIFWLCGWRLDNRLPPEVCRCVMVAAPHTSNWDFFYARLAFILLRIPVRFTVKKEWLRFPFWLIMRPLGAIGIDRSPKLPGQPRRSMVEAMTQLFAGKGTLVVLVTPEGTRKKATKWKTGFYYVALNAGVPICLGYLDYQNKVAGVGKTIYPSGNYQKDMREIMMFYKNIPPKYPEKFSLDMDIMNEGT